MNVLRTPFASFANPRFRGLWWLVLLSALPVTVAWTLLVNFSYEISGSLSAASNINGAAVLAGLALIPLGGVLADRCSRRRLVIGAQCVMAAVLLAIGALILFDRATMPLLIALSLALAAAAAILVSARDVWVADLIPKRLLANGLVLLAGGTALVAVTGTVLFWLSVLEWGVDYGWGCLVLAFALLAGLAFALRLPRSYAAPAQRIGLLRELRAGIAYLARTPRLRSLWLFALLISICAGGAQLLVDYELATTFVGVRVGSIEMFAAFGAASVVIMLVLAGLLSDGTGWHILIGFAAIVVFGTWLGAAARSADLLAAARHIAVAAAATMVLITTVLTLINAKPQYYGRVLSLLVVAFGLGGAVHLTVFNFGDIWIAAQFDSRDSLWALGALAIAGAALMLLSWRRALGSPPEPGSAVAAMLGPPIAAFSPDLVAQIALSRAQRGPDDEERFG